MSAAFFVEMISIRHATPLDAEFFALRDESLAEGFTMLKRLAENWASGLNTFARTGERFYGAFEDEMLVGMGGLNVDPYVEQTRAGRIRHLYVSKGSRRRGVGRHLLDALLNGASGIFDVVNTRAPIEAYPFYERMGFRRVMNSGTATHRLTLRNLTASP